jgi:Rrf2 family protein
MKISTKGRYALRLMVDLAMDNTGEYVTIKSISGRQEISDKYLEQIITQLCRAGYVISARGASGGYKLAHAPEHYTVGMILRLMEGSLAPVPCLETETNTCHRAAQCVTVEVWKKISDAVDDVVDHITLADLVKRQAELCPTGCNI